MGQRKVSTERNSVKKSERDSTPAAAASSPPSAAVKRLARFFTFTMRDAQRAMEMASFPRECRCV